MGSFQKASRNEFEGKRKREDEKESPPTSDLASVYKEFVDTFQQSSAVSKTWVKAGTYDAGSRKEDSREKGKLYKPTPKNNFSQEDHAQKLESEVHNKKQVSHSSKKKAQEKKKSNLELFKEELRQMQEEREERHK